MRAPPCAGAVPHTTHAERAILVGGCRTGAGPAAEQFTEGLAVDLNGPAQRVLDRDRSVPSKREAKILFFSLGVTRPLRPRETTHTTGSKSAAK